MLASEAVTEHENQDAGGDGQVPSDVRDEARQGPNGEGAVLGEVSEARSILLRKKPRAGSATSQCLRATPSPQGDEAGAALSSHRQPPHEAQERGADSGREFEAEESQARR